MRLDRMKLQLAAFVVLSGGVGANIFLLQSHALERFASSIASKRPTVQVAAADAREFIGDTGSIGVADAVSTEEPSRAPTNPSVAQQMPQDAAAVTRAVQRELQARGYDTGATDGVTGVMTRAAIVGFEFDHGLALTGKPSQALLKVILLGGDAAPLKGFRRPQSADATSLIKSVQKSLAERGYNPGPVSGQLTPATTRAIREFEVDQSLPESGRPSGQLVARLARSTGRVASSP
jgi:peptidoglycan hydrolase-like protein with peptidoglycan-binding domain